MPQIIQPVVDPEVLSHHASRHSEGGLDPLTPAAIGAATDDHTHDNKADLVNGKVPTEQLPPGLASLDWTDIENKPVDFPPSIHGHDELYSSLNHDHEGEYANLIAGKVPVSQLPYVDENGDITSGIPYASPTVAGIVKISDDFDVSEEGVLSISKLYTVEIDFSVSSPTGCISYGDDAAVMTAAQRKALAYSWVKPTVVRPNGTINYELDRSNLANKKDGTAAVLTGADGDVCASFSPLWFKVTKAGKKVTINISETPRDGFITAHLYDGVVREYVHIGMFEASGSTCASVYSTTTNPTVSTTLKTFRTQANAKGALCNPVTWLTWQMYQIVYLFAYGSLDSQTAVGMGVNDKTWTGSFNGLPVANADLLICNGEYGGSAQIMALFVVNPWGNVWEFRDGIIWNGGTIVVAKDQKSIYDIEQGYANKPADWETIATGLGTGLSGAYISETVGDDYAAFFPFAASGSSATFCCDGCWGATGERCCIVGGAFNHGALGGVFTATVSNTLSHSSFSIGARVQILNAS